MSNFKKAKDSDYVSESEEIFSKCCVKIGYKPIKIKEQGMPDFKVHCDEIVFVAEIKELNKNPADEIEIRQLAEHEQIQGGHYTGKRAGVLINKAANQIEKLKHLNVPTVIVLYDNIVSPSGGRTPSSGLHLSSTDIFSAMYENEFRIVESNGVESFKNVNRFPFSDSDKEYISAVIVMIKYGTKMKFFVYHNHFTKHEFPTSIFPAPIGFHFQKSNKAGEEWKQLN